MDVWRLIAERKIDEAMAEGAFAHLSGVGQPLRLEDDPFEAPSMRMAHRLLRNNGFAPAWIEEARELDADIEILRAELRRALRAGDPGRSSERVAALNRRIAVFNLKAPSTVWHRMPIDAHREMSRREAR